MNERAIRIIAILLTLILAGTFVYWFLPTPREEQDIKSSATASPILETENPSVAESSQRLSEERSKHAIIAGRSMTADSFFLPGIGDVHSYSVEEALNFADASGKAHPLPMKVFYDAKGNFLRAEYVSAGAVNFEAPREMQERSYRKTFREELSLLGRPPIVPLSQILSKVYEAVESRGKFDDATRLNITYVRLLNHEGPPPHDKPVFIVNAYGTGKLKLDFPNEERFKRIRFVLDEKGNLLWIDNNI